MTATTTTTIAAFILARVEEDERAANYANTRDGQLSDHDTQGWWLGHYQHYTRHDPARVLAQCAAVRAVVALHSAHDTPQRMVYGTIIACNECGSVDDSPVEWPCPTLCALAKPYADHPEFRPEWAS